jgi:hypothetical protein
MPDAHPLRPQDPAALGAYRLVGRLGEGNQGVVYLGLDPSGEYVAIKLLHARMAADPGSRDRFVRELSAAKMVARFCTAHVLDADVAGDQPYIVSEYVAGRSLRSHIAEEGPRSGGSLERLAVGTLTALTAIHRAGVVHRDFNPHNVLLGPDGPRVIDFGIARALGAVRSNATDSAGTPAYMAPEQVLGGEIGPPADMFAWGSTILFAATGRPPFGNESVAAVMDRITRTDPDVSALPEPLRSVVSSCLAKDPARRPTAGLAQACLLGHDATPLMPPPAFGASCDLPDGPAVEGAEGSGPRPVSPDGHPILVPGGAVTGEPVPAVTANPAPASTAGEHPAAGSPSPAEPADAVADPAPGDGPLEFVFDSIAMPHSPVAHPAAMPSSGLADPASATVAETEQSPATEPFLAVDAAASGDGAAPTTVMAAVPVGLVPDPESVPDPTKPDLPAQPVSAAAAHGTAARDPAGDRAGTGPHPGMPPMTATTGPRRPPVGLVFLAGAAAVVTVTILALSLWPGGGDAATSAPSTPTPAATSASPRPLARIPRASGMIRATHHKNLKPVGCHAYTEMYTVSGAGTVMVNANICRTGFSGTAIIADMVPTDGYDVCLQLGGHLTGPGKTFLSTELISSASGGTHRFDNGPRKRFGPDTTHTEDYILLNVGRCKGSTPTWQIHDRLKTG